MIIKGSSRGHSQHDVDRLARHLMARENETAIVLEGCGGPADLGATLAAMRATTLGTRSRRALMHCSLSLPADEAFDLADGRWIEAVDCLERHLGLTGHQRVVVGHQKKGRRHAHVVWCRAHPETLRVVNDGHTYRKHEAASRELEDLWNCRPVVGVHTRPAGTQRPVAQATHQCWQAQERTGVSVASVATILQQAWATTDSGTAFRAAIEQQGLHLAAGRRGIIVVDGAGTPHSIPRRLVLRAAEVQRRLADLDAAALPTVETIKSTICSHHHEESPMPQRQQYGIGPRRRRRQPDEPAQPRPDLRPEYWTTLGYTVDVHPSWLTVTLSPTATLVDHGDRLVLDRAGPPTDEEIKLMVTAAKDRGWQGIYFWGSEDFQRRAQAEAIRQGFEPAAITLECEKDKPALTAEPMPQHIRRRLAPPAEPDVPAPQVVPAPTPAPAPEFRP